MLHFGERASENSLAVQSGCGIVLPMATRRSLSLRDATRVAGMYEWNQLARRVIKGQKGTLHSDLLGALLNARPHRTVSRCRFASPRARFRKRPEQWTLDYAGGSGAPHTSISPSGEPFDRLHVSSDRVEAVIYHSATLNIEHRAWKDLRADMDGVPTSTQKLRSKCFTGAQIVRCALRNRP